MNLYWEEAPWRLVEVGTDTKIPTVKATIYSNGSGIWEVAIPSGFGFRSVHNDLEEAKAMALVYVRMPDEHE